MKKLFIFIILLYSVTSFSQVDRRIGSNQYKRAKREKINYTEATLDFFKKEINIDAFQEAVIKNLVDEYQASGKEISESKTLNDIEKKERFTLLSEKFKKKLFEILSIEQQEKYDELMSQSKEKKKK